MPDNRGTKYPDRKHAYRAIEPLLGRLLGFRPIAGARLNVQHRQMNESPTEPRDRLIDFYLDDASDRLRFQQEFSVAGFKSLILINGGAVIALLTYAGNARDEIEAASLQWAFGGYVVGLIAAMLAYLTAYAGQALIMQHSASAALAEMGVTAADEKTQKQRVGRANFWIRLGVALCVLSVAAFLGGSIAAMRSLIV